MNLFKSLNIFFVKYIFFLIKTHFSKQITKYFTKNKIQNYF
jgi:hypothetical protein